jgi:hypothetical protein
MAEPAKTQQRQHAEAVQHITDAHQVLSKKLEMALAILSVKTGGFL